MSEQDRITLEHDVHEALHSYCRGIDRLDPNSIKAGFQFGATLVDYGPNIMTIEEFATHAVASLKDRFVSTQHRISNTTIERRSDKSGTYALVETYVHAMHVEHVEHVESSETGRKLHTFVGRYIDRFERLDPDRAGQDLRPTKWRIAHRTLRNDWTTVESIPDAMRGAYVPSGRAGTPDPIWP